MCHRCAGHLVAGDREVYCLSCGWRGYQTRRLFRLSSRDRARRRARVRRVALEATQRGACFMCGDVAVTAKFCQRHRDMTNAAARARTQSRRAAGLCRDCELPAVTKDYCAGHRARHNQRLRAALGAAGSGASRRGVS